MRGDSADQRGADKSDTSCYRIDDKARKPRVTATRLELLDLQRSDQDHGHRCDRHLTLWKRKANGESDQNEGERVFAILTERGGTVIARRTEVANATAAIRTTAPVQSRIFMTAA